MRHVLPAGRRAWIHVARGALEINGERTGAGDAAAVTEAGPLELVARAASEVLVFDMA